MSLPDWNLIKSKLSILADAAKYDASCSSSGSHRKRDAKGMGNVEGMGICHSYAPDGRCISLLKILMTNFCIFDCKYCVNRVSSDVKRAKFSPDEIVTLTLEFYRRNYIEGLFLSSGIIESSDATMEKLIQVAKTLRQVHRFNGYIHLKVVAGSSQELIEEAGLWADRVSANVEMPVQKDLDILAPAKTIESATTSMNQIAEKVSEAKEEQKKSFRFRAPKFAPAGQTTQMIVGATGSTDSLILNSSQSLYRKYALRRVYYSAYSPIPHSDVLLPTEQPQLVRENRLYQADWLLRFYNFEAQELVNDENPDLPLDMDPKSAWALRNRQYFPVDVNSAAREQLLRVPGLGVRNVERILQMRPHRKISLLDLGKLRVPLKRTKYFVITSDHNPDVFLLDSQHLKKNIAPESTQLSLFDIKQTAVSGEI
ncbi:putative DNA modification/repair radical SAM protein [Bdellovibrio sp. NC01]|uniref:putative DNA modification/repair radical SAM protein n=1 Tax=Bdellovibrio sp. NC01 TaxID=2220073 RepID=UPI00115AB984|nr:putative DNA modification/repair radical SAM protein [Bdellovibrio sp. NC01]QDK39317.1 putative DNA modification/repair radical SAM protein [Bdellovibrio sp. NC01]